MDLLLLIKILLQYSHKLTFNPSQYLVFAWLIFQPINTEKIQDSNLMVEANIATYKDSDRRLCRGEDLTIKYNSFLITTQPKFLINSNLAYVIICKQRIRKIVNLD